MIETESVNASGVYTGGYQYVWSPRYIDAPICRDTVGADGNLIAPTAGGRIYYLDNADYNVTSVVKYISGDWTVAEHYAYDPYGQVTVYNADLGLRRRRRLGQHRGQHALLHRPRARRRHRPLLHACPLLRSGSGAVHEPRTSAYEDGANLYAYVGDNPTNASDPSGNQRTNDEPADAPATVTNCITGQAYQRNCREPSYCTAHLASILDRAALLKLMLDRYDPTADGIGGAAGHWGGTPTQPGTHYNNIVKLMKALRKDIADYYRNCVNCKDKNPDPVRDPVPDWVHDLVGSMSRNLRLVPSPTQPQPRPIQWPSIHIPHIPAPDLTPDQQTVVVGGTGIMCLAGICVIIILIPVSRDSDARCPLTSSTLRIANNYG